MRTAAIVVAVLVVLMVVAASLLAPAPKRWPRRVTSAAWRRTSVRGRWQRRRPLLLFYVALAVIVAVVLIVWVLPSVLTEHPRIPKSADRHTAIANTRTSLVAMLAAIGAAGGLAFTARTYRLSREGHVTDRYSKAVEQLGSDKIAVRLGATYALERLMRDSPADQPTIMEVLAAYVRQHAALPRPSRLDTSDEPPHTGLPAPAHAGEHHHRPIPDLIYLAADVQAVLAVLGRRRLVDSEGPIDLELSNLTGARLDRANLTGALLNSANLTESWLRGAQLMHCRLDWADLTGAALDEADLTSAQLSRGILTGAGLVQANLTGANLVSAQLTGANLNQANLSGADLALAQLTGADLALAQMTGANLMQANLTGANLVLANLTGANLDRANLTDAQLVRGTLSPAQLAAASHVDKILWRHLGAPPP